MQSFVNSAIFLFLFAYCLTCPLFLLWWWVMKPCSHLFCPSHTSRAPCLGTLLCVAHPAGTYLGTHPPPHTHWSGPYRQIPPTGKPPWSPEPSCPIYAMEWNSNSILACQMRRLWESTGRATKATKDHIDSESIITALDAPNPHSWRYQESFINLKGLSYVPRDVTSGPKDQTWEQNKEL
jgi:hypothetical protein